MNTIATPYHFKVSELIHEPSLCQLERRGPGEVAKFSLKIPPKFSQRRLGLLRPITFGRFGIVDAAKHMP